jgi:hypothetical protein
MGSQVVISEQRQKNARIRRRLWYYRYRRFADFLKKNPSKRDILIAIHSLIDDIDGYHYQHIAYSARESLDIVIKDTNLKKSHCRFK